MTHISPVQDPFYFDQSNAKYSSTANFCSPRTCKASTSSTNEVSRSVDGSGVVCSVSKLTEYSPDAYPDSAAGCDDLFVGDGGKNSKCCEEVLGDAGGEEDV